MFIHDVIVSALHKSFAEFTDDQAETVIAALKDAGFAILPKEPSEKVLFEMRLTACAGGGAEAIYETVVKQGGF